MAMGGHQCLIYVGMFWCLSSFVLLSSSIDPVTTLECHRRQYSYKVQQTDSEGRTCWDHINVMSCWGRCDSNEIADWKFPYKKSHHPVCLHSSTQEKKVTLRNCDADVAQETKIYTFQEAASCSCSFCRSSEASCEGLRYRGARRAPRQIKRTFPSTASKYSLMKLYPQLLLKDPSGANLLEVLEPQNELRQMIKRSGLGEAPTEILSPVAGEKLFGKRRESASVGQIPFVDASLNSNLDFLSFLDDTFGSEKQEPLESESLPRNSMKEDLNDMFGIKWLQN